MEFRHETVLLEETVELLQPRAGKLIVDGTLGAGGHAQALLERGARVLGVDRDPRALAAAGARLSGHAGFSSAQGSFAELPELLEERGLGPVDGILLDLGVSSPQLEVPERGFSFMREGPLDMRMGDFGPTAAELIASSDEEELIRVLREYGEEPFARPIARELRRQLPATTLAAAAAVERAVPRKAWPKSVHVATRTFQALRIAVNGELAALDAFLEAMGGLLAPGGVAAIISFHSLEDRRVKQGFRALEGRCTCPPGLPVCGCGRRPLFRDLTRGGVVASAAEVARNPRARSARLRAVEKLS